MKLYPLIITYLFVFGACKQTAPLESGEANRTKAFMPSNCKSHNHWTPEQCGREPTGDNTIGNIRQMQVVVTHVWEIDNDLKKTLSRNDPSISLCAGRVHYWGDGAWQQGVGFWLEGFGLGCYPGVDYKRQTSVGHDHGAHWGLDSKDRYINFDRKGANVVSVPPSHFYTYNPRRDIVNDLCTGDHREHCRLTKAQGALVIVPTK